MTDYFDFYAALAQLNYKLQQLNLGHKEKGDLAEYIRDLNKRVGQLQHDIESTQSLLIAQEDNSV